MAKSIRRSVVKEATLDAWLRQRVVEAFTDLRPGVPAHNVFKRLRQHHTRQVKARRTAKV
jgi:hypothetical protein